MKNMFVFLRSLSRTVHHEVREEHVEEAYTMDDKTHVCKTLIVWRKSLVLNCKGFTVFDSDGNLVYRVDNYSAHPSEIILMDGYGKAMLSVCRRKQNWRLVDDWLIYKEDNDNNNNSADSNKQPIFVARKQLNYYNPQQNGNNVLAQLYAETTSNYKNNNAYSIEGCYAQRSCKIYDKSRKVVAEIKKKEEAKGVSFGSDVFVLITRPGFDQGLALAIVLLLDQMFS